MTYQEKIALLSRNIWRKKEVNAYYDGIFTTCEINAILRRIKNKTLAPKQTVYRDEVLKIMKTSFEKEMKTLERCNQEKEIEE